MPDRVQTNLPVKTTGPILLCFLTVMSLLLMQFLILNLQKLAGKGLSSMMAVEFILTVLSAGFILTTASLCFLNYIQPDYKPLAKR